MAELGGQILCLLIGVQSPRPGFFDSFRSAADLGDVAEVVGLQLQVVDLVFDVLREILCSWQQMLLDQVEHVFADFDALLLEPPQVLLDVARICRVLVHSLGFLDSAPGDPAEPDRVLVGN